MLFDTGANAYLSTKSLAFCFGTMLFDTGANALNCIFVHTKSFGTSSFDTVTNAVSNIRGINSFGTS